MIFLLYFHLKNLLVLIYITLDIKNNPMKSNNFFLGFLFYGGSTYLFLNGDYLYRFANGGESNTNSSLLFC